MLSKSLSKRLLTSVLSVYFILTFVVTCGQVIAEYHNSKDHIQNELSTFQKTFSGSLTRAIWELNTQQTRTIAEGLLAMPTIEGVIVRDDSGEIISQLGQSIDIGDAYNDTLVVKPQLVQQTSSGLFGYTFPLIFEFSGRATQVGDVTLFSSRNVVLSRIMVSIYFLVGNALIKTTFLIILFLMAFRRLLTEPLTDLTHQIEELELDNLEGVQVSVHTTEHNELKIMEYSFNNLIDKVIDYKNQLEATQKQLVSTNEKLDQQNLMLEQEVARKTSNLSQAMMDLQQQKYELEKQKLTLTEEVDRRKTTESELLQKQDELTRYVDELNLAQERLVGSEKMAALGGLVAGITHDINTPVGIGVTATSFLEERLNQIEIAYQDKSLSPKALEEFIRDAKQSTSLLATNLERASELVASFKQIAVDQASEAVRNINLKEYLSEIIRSLQPKLKKTMHKINIHCPDDLKLNLPAGAISQIFTNLIMNSLIHSFEGVNAGSIDIAISEHDGEVRITYRDDGRGVSQEQLDKLFDPFFTTRREQGGSGLGTHITFNLVKQTLGGDITATSEIGKGLTYEISFPKDMPSPMSMLAE